MACQIPLSGSAIVVVQKHTTTQSQNSKLLAFRQSVYKCITRARDSLFELMDAVLVMPRVKSFPELSTAGVFRRRWSSLYEALEDGQIDREKILRLEIEHLPADEQPLLAGDHTAWAREQAYTLKDRTFEHQPSPIKGQKPITIGHGYSTLGVVPEKGGSWFLPLLHERIKSEMTPSAKMAEQLREVCSLLPNRPLGLFDSEYGSGLFIKETKGIDCDLLFRLRPNRKLRREPPPYPGFGRPPKHGAVFRLSDPATWPEPDQEWEVEDEKLGPVIIRQWNNLHFQDAPDRLVTAFRVERLNARKTRRDPGVVWLGYCGSQNLPPQLWRHYLSRYIIEHWYRFINQSLSWKLPRLGTPEQSELWSVLMVLVSWQLWLSRSEVADNPQTWQKPQPPEKMTPGRVHQSIAGVLAGIGTPAQPPKPRGKSSGFLKGSTRTKRLRHEVIKKRCKPVAKAKKQALIKEFAPP